MDLSLRDVQKTAGAGGHGTVPAGEVPSAGPSSPRAAAGQTSHLGGIAEPISMSPGATN